MYIPGAGPGVRNVADADLDVEVTVRVKTWR